MKRGYRILEVERRAWTSHRPHRKARLHFIYRLRLPTGKAARFRAGGWLSLLYDTQRRILRVFRVDGDWIIPSTEPDLQMSQMVQSYVMPGPEAFYAD